MYLFKLTKIDSFVISDKSKITEKFKTDFSYLDKPLKLVGSDSVKVNGINHLNSEIGKIKKDYELLIQYVLDLDDINEYEIQNLGSYDISNGVKVEINEKKQIKFFKNKLKQLEFNEILPFLEFQYSHSEKKEKSARN